MKFHHWKGLNGVLQNVVYGSKYLKRIINYSYGHPGSFNPAVITNKEAHKIYGNMNKEAGSSCQEEKVENLRLFFAKLNSTLLKVSLGCRCFI